MGNSIDQLWDIDQWSYIRKNLGAWHGTFIQFSSNASRVSDTPSVLTLKEDRPGQHMTLVLKRTPQGKDTHTMERELGYPGAVPYICFFPTGAFSQGAMQRRPFSSFGAEFSLLSEHRRMRLVQLYTGIASGEHTLDYVTLIPEHRFPETATTPPSETPETPAVTARLSVDTLLGTWQGQRIYLPATMETPEVGTSYWQAQRSNGELIFSSGPESSSPESSGPESKGQSTACQRFVPVDHHRWQAVDQPLQLWLLPGGVSCTLYPQLPRDHGARLEFCWYLSSQQRQRIVRDYNDTGDWLGTALMLETRV